MQRRRLGKRNCPINAKLRMQLLQHFLAPGEVRMARQRDKEVGRERGQTGFEKLTGFLVVQSQVAGQFQDQRFACGKGISLLPIDEGTTMDPDDFSKLLLREKPTLAKSSEHHSKGGKVILDHCHQSALL